MCFPLLSNEIRRTNFVESVDPFVIRESGWQAFKLVHAFPFVRSTGDGMAQER
jgi:hypothetical protein